jgi:imidazolonepropionase-like amidohydrolase
MNCHDDSRLVLAMAGRSQQLLESGVTTVRDLGDRGALTIQLREATTAGEIAGPRILAATAPLTPPAGHCWFLGGQVDGHEEIRAQIERNAAAGADLIKVMVSGGSIAPRGARMWESQFHTDDLKVAVQAAHRLGLPVAAHAHGLASIRSAIDAGVGTIEHCTWLDGGMTPNHDEATVADLVASGIAVCTANTNNWRIMAKRLGEQRAKEIIGRVRWMRDRGVRLIVGTDAGLSPFTDTVGALEGLADWGMSNSEIIEIATTGTAEAIGLANTGRIAPGHCADIIVVHGNPLDDLTRLRDIRVVMTRGRVIPGTLPVRGGKVTGQVVVA